MKMNTIKKIVDICITAFFAIVALGLGALMLWSGLKENTEKNQKRSHYKTTIGTVVEIKERETTSGKSRRNQSLYYPVYEYEVDGKTYRFDDSGMASNGHKAIGSQEKIYYDPDNPNEVIVGKRNSSSLTDVAGGCFCLMVGLVIIISQLKFIKQEIRNFISAMLISLTMIGVSLTYLILYPFQMPLAIAVFIIFIVCSLCIMGISIYKTFFKRD